MSQEKYNGWSNYETWCVNLWLENEYLPGGLIQLIEDDIFEKEEEEEEFTLEEKIGLLSTRLKEWVEGLQEHLDMPTTGLFCDLIGAALSEVDWWEIAEDAFSDTF